MYMDGLSGCIYVHRVHAWCLWRLEEGIGSPRTRLTDCYELLCEYEKPNQGSLQEQASVLQHWTISPSPDEYAFNHRPRLYSINQHNYDIKLNSFCKRQGVSFACNSRTWKVEAEEQELQARFEVNLSSMRTYLKTLSNKKKKVETIQRQKSYFFKVFNQARHRNTFESQLIALFTWL